jgi:hypothetical protein
MAGTDLRVEEFDDSPILEDIALRLRKIKQSGDALFENNTLPTGVNKFLLISASLKNAIY